MLRKPEKLARLVRGIAAKSALPLTVKVRLAPEGGEVNVREVVDLLRDAGAVEAGCRHSQNRPTPGGV